jgi:hypothetical protein
MKGIFSANRINQAKIKKIIKFKNSELIIR